MSISRTVTVLTESGIHARPAAALVETAKRFQANLSMESLGRQANCKSLVSVLKLGVPKGATVTLTAHGSDEEDAIRELMALLDPLALEGHT
jgi:phosphocarrier protein HPr